MKAKCPNKEVNYHNKDDNKIIINHPVYTMYIVSQSFYQVASGRFIDEETRAPIGETNLPMVSQLVNGGARFQML